MSDFSHDELALIEGACKSPLNPVKDITKRKYFDIYREIVAYGKTEAQIADERGMTIQTVSEIKRWCQRELEGENYQGAVEDLKYRLQIKRQKYANLLKDAEADEGPKRIKNILAIMEADRKNDLLLSKVEGWLTSNVEIGKREIVVMMGDRRIDNKQEGEVIDAQADS